MDSEVINVDELNADFEQLELKLQRLKKLIDYVPVSPHQKFLMQLQYSAMNQYSAILAERISYTVSTSKGDNE